MQTSLHLSPDKKIERKILQYGGGGGGEDTTLLPELAAAAAPESINSRRWRPSAHLAKNRVSDLLVLIKTESGEICPQW